MRRGLLSWSEDEVPRSVLDARVTRLRVAMAANGLDAVLVYTSFPRPAAVSYLTHFVPYWSQGVLTVLPDRAPVFTVSLSKRVANWIEETAHVGDIMCTPNIGLELGAMLMREGGVKRVGVVELNKLPGLIVANLRQADDAIELIDATKLFAEFRAVADDTEIALSRRAAEIAHTALDLAKPDGAPVEADILAAIERSARMQGCEEILIDIAEDLTSEKHFRRLDGPSVFKNRYAVRLSVAYKGHWVRVGRTFQQVGETHDMKIENFLSKAALPGTKTEKTVIESCIGSAPLSEIHDITPGSIISVTGRWRDDDGFWLASEPMLMGEPATLLIDR